MYPQPSLIFTRSIAALLYWVAFYFYAILEMIGGITQRRRVRRREATRVDRGSFCWMFAGIGVSLTAGFLLTQIAPWADFPGSQVLPVVAGALLILLGTAFRWYAIRTLGRYFTRDVAVSADQPVVQAGPYRWIRHPAYTGTLVTTVGVGLGMANWLSMIVVLGVSIASHLYRVRVEEQALCAAIGQPYRDYMERTKRFVPFVY
jgi:protein-S-isoprenylcysteine O-methyltransferase Ste14